MIMWIEGRKVMTRAGKYKQTVNFAPEDEGMDYDPRVVISPVDPDLDAKLLARSSGTKVEAIQYLVQECGGHIDPPLEKYAHIGETGTVSANAIDGKSRSRTEQMTPEWIEEAVLAFERVVDQFILQFIHFPYLHRVEQSLHCELYRLLLNERIFASMYPMSGVMSQSVHKEWKEYKPRPEKDNRRGNIDLCIISPDRLKSCTREEFVQARIQPDIAVEIGLECGFRHLDDDSKKLLNSAIEHGYVVHLVRQRTADNFDALEEFLLSGSLGKLKTGYARLCGSQAFYKLLNDAEIKRMPTRP